ncbi:MAG: ankyrin repeat domain-containing protein [Proteobacteria bacterium]|nr:ankyrin repeat domain-containing protein [Pseudomonadota bacterium]
MNFFKKSLLVSTCLFLGGQSTWGMTDDDGPASSISIAATKKKETEQKDSPPALPETEKRSIAYPLFSPEHTDYIRLINIRHLLANRDKVHPIYLLRNLSWQVDGMHVLKRSFRDRTRDVVPIWSLLAYLHKGLAVPDLSQEFSAAFVAQFTPHLSEIQETLAALENLECRKSSIRQTMARAPGHLARETFKSHMTRHFASEDSSGTGKPTDSDLMARDFLLSVGKTPIDDELRKIEKCSLFTHEYRFEASLECVADYIRACSGDVAPIEELRERVKVEEQRLNETLNDIERKPSTLRLQRLIGILYEYRSLEEAFEALKSLEPLNGSDKFSTALERRVLFQTITVLGEALNNISTPLDLDQSEDILRVIPSLKYVRNVLEHPEGYKQQKLDALLLNGDFAKRIWQGLTQDLLALRIPLEKRLAKLRGLITGKEKCEEKLTAILGHEGVSKIEDGPEPGMIPRKGKRIDLLMQQAHWMNNGLRYVQWLRRYFYHPSYGQIDPDHEDLSASAKTVVSVEGKSGYLKPKDQEKVVKVEEIISDIRELTQITGQFPTRNDFIVRLKGDRALRYGLVNLANQIYFKLNRNVEGHNLEFYRKLSHENKKQFEIIFGDMKDRRNYSVHDLWRQDLRGLGTLLHIRLKLLQSILESVTKSIPRVPPVKATRQMWREIYDQSLSLERLETLIGEGADVNALDREGNSPLAYAVNEWNEDLIHSLLDHGADPNLCDKSGIYPIHTAAEDGRLDLVLLLNESGADLDCKDVNGQTPEDYATRAGAEDCAAYLRGGCARFRGDTADTLHRNLDPLWLQAEHVDPILGYCPNFFDADGRLPLVISIEKSEAGNAEGILKIVKSLVSVGADVNQRQLLDGQSALIATAQYSGSHELLLFLLDAGADVTVVDNYGWSALHHAAQQGKDAFVTILLDRQADVSLGDSDGRTPLLVHLNTSKGGNIETVKLLLARGASPNDKDSVSGMSALDYAAKNGRRDIYELLLQHGAVPSASSSSTHSSHSSSDPLASLKASASPKSTLARSSESSSSGDEGGSSEGE